MKVRSLFSICSSSASDYSTLPINPSQPPTPIINSDTTSTSSSSSSSSSSTISQTSSLQSNLSLQTLPSVPSLQLKFSPPNISVTHSSLKPHPYHVNFLSIHNNFLYAASGDFVNVFDVTNLAHLDTFYVKDSSSGSVKSITFYNQNIFTAHQDCKIRAWEFTEHKRHKLIATLPTVKDRLRRFMLPKNYVKVRRHIKRLWIQHNDAVSGLAINKSSELMCSVSWDKYLKIWRTSNYRCIESIKAHDDAINAVAVAVDGTIYTASADRRIRVWGSTVQEKIRGSNYNKCSKHSLIATLEKHKSAVNALALNDDGWVLFSGACDRSILVWEREDSANYMVVTGALRGHGKAILCLIHARDLLFSGSADRTVRIWQRGQEGKFCCLTVLDGHAKPVRSLAAAMPDDKWGDVEGGGIVKVFSGSFDGEIKVWEVVVSSLCGSTS